MLRQFIEAFLLNGLGGSPLVQVTLLFIVELYFIYSVFKNKPYVFLAQSRVELVTVFARFLTYFIAFLSTSGAMSLLQAASSLLVIQLIMLLNVSLEYCLIFLIISQPQLLLLLLFKIRLYVV